MSSDRRPLNILLILVLSFSSGFSQKGLVVSGGVNFANIIFTEPGVEHGEDKKLSTGLKVSLEVPVRSFICGIAFTQRGAKLFITSGIGGDQHLRMNYLSCRFAYPLEITNRLNLYLGSEVSKFTNGDIVYDYLGYESLGEIEATRVDLDYGIIGGFEFWRSEQFGLRSEYYRGIQKNDILDDRHFVSTHTGFSLNLLFRL